MLNYTEPLYKKYCELGSYIEQQTLQTKNHMSKFIDLKQEAFRSKYAITTIGPGYFYIWKCQFS